MLSTVPTAGQTLCGYVFTQLPWHEQETLRAGLANGVHCYPDRALDTVAALPVGFATSVGVFISPGPSTIFLASPGRRDI